MNNWLDESDLRERRREWGRKGGLAKHNPELMVEARREARALLARYPHLTAQELFDRLGPSTGLTLYMAKKVRRESREPREQPQQRPSRAPYRASAGKWEQLSAFLQQHQGETFDRAQLAAAAGIEPKEVTRLFRLFTGQPFSQSPAASERAREYGRRSLSNHMERKRVYSLRSVGQDLAEHHAAWAAGEMSHLGEDEPQETLPTVGSEVAMFSEYGLGTTFTVVGQTRDGVAITAVADGTLFHQVRS
jgi:hypothetical protein